MRTFKYHSKKYKVCTFFGIVSLLVSVMSMMLLAFFGLGFAKVTSALGVLALAVVSQCFPEE